VIRVDHLNFGYKDGFRLEDVTIDVKAGEFLGIIGPNGSGKSTFLKVLSKILAPISGSVTVDGSPLERLNMQAIAQKVAFVGTEMQFAFPFRVLEVVLMGRLPFVGRLGALNANDYARAEEALRRTEALEFRDRYIMELSSGERQRVLLARALAQSPKILLLDEPTAHLDMHFELEIFHILRSLNQQEGLTILAVSHNLNLMAEFCRQLLVLNRGRRHQIGPPNEILTPAMIQEVFRIECKIVSNPFSSAPNIVVKA